MLYHSTVKNEIPEWNCFQKDERKDYPMYNPLCYTRE